LPERTTRMLSGKRLHEFFSSRAGIAALHLAASAT
jgi:hypothetical protein